MVLKGTALIKGRRVACTISMKDGHVEYTDVSEEKARELKASLGIDKKAGRYIRVITETGDRWIIEEDVRLDSVSMPRVRRTKKKNK